MPDDALLEYLKADFAGRLNLAAKLEMEPVLRDYLGDSGYEELRCLAENHRKRTAAEHLGSKAPKNLIFIPGVMGSLLMPKNAGGIWWIDLGAIGLATGIFHAARGNFIGSSVRI